MRAREILSKNLRTLIDHARETDPRLGAIKKVADASAGKLTNGKVGRIAAGTHTTDIDTLVDLAEVFGLQPWQLLVENLNPKALPRLADAALLSQIKQIVDSVPGSKEKDSASLTDEHALQTLERTRGQVRVGPALQEAFGQRVKKNAGDRSTAAPKSKGRRRG